MDFELFLFDEFIENFERLTVEEQLATMHFEEAITHSVDNSLYQAELGLLDDFAKNNLSKVIDAAFPRWEKMGVPIPPRIVRWKRDTSPQQ